MGMGYMANFVEEIYLEDLVKIGRISELWAELEAGIAKEGRDFSDFAQAVSTDYLDDWESPEQLIGKLKEIYAEFRKETGLDLYIDYHDADNDGDRYDEVVGAFWGVLGMYELTPAGRAIGDKVQRRFFVTYG
jgi:hypothetical protein